MPSEPLPELQDPRWERRSGRVREDESGRSPTHRDRDRVLYSEAFRRLGGVTQVAQGTAEMLLHNRLTHSLKVEQVGSSIVSRWSDEPDLAHLVDLHAVLAACLAHDLGHPPFGHAGEMELDELVTCAEHRDKPRPRLRRTEDPCSKCLLEDGFEGNAQSFRILTRLAVHRGGDGKDHYGLDLTRETLAACTKYPWTRGEPGRKVRKWGAYDCDAEVLKWSIGGDAADPSLNAEVMDWADDISYAVHDVEDFYRTSLIPVDDYRSNTATLERFLEYVQSDSALGRQSDEVLAALENLLELFPSSRFNGRTEDLESLDVLRSTLLGKFISAASTLEGRIVREPTQEAINSILKQLIWFHVIDDPRLAAIQEGQRRVLREIFQHYHPLVLETYNSGSDKDPDEHMLRRLPFTLRRAITVGLTQSGPRYKLKQQLTRGVLDYIASLSDLEAYSVHAVIKGRAVAGHL